MIYSYMVTRNESSRYLDACLSWNLPHIDGLAVYDDHSTDDTVELARQHGAKATIRSDDVPSFMEHEGQFRQAAWEWMQDVFEPGPEDWILALDADEFLCGDVRSDIAAAQEQSAEVVLLTIPEVFDINGPQVRIDGWWGKINAPRLFAWKPDGLFSQKSMGCGAEPTYVRESAALDPAKSVLLHYGYAAYDDRLAKFNRYTNAMNHGHSPTHVKSILATPTLRLWAGSVPEVWRGKR